MPRAPPLGSTILWFHSPCSAEVAEPCSSPMILPPTSALAAQPSPDSPSHHDRALSAHSQLRGCSLSPKPGYTPPRSTPVSPSWPASLIDSIPSKSLLPWAPKHCCVQFREHHGPKDRSCARLRICWLILPPPWTARFRRMDNS